MTLAISSEPEVAAAAIKEMVRQKGGGLLCDERGMAFRGVIVRHLVLPGQVENSKRVVRWIADELPWNVHVSVMSQYYPNELVASGQWSVVGEDALNRTITREEYDEVAAAMENAGLVNGWLQEMDSNKNYRPDFEKTVVSGHWSVVSGQ